MSTYTATMKISYWVNAEVEAQTHEQAKEALEAMAWAQHLDNSYGEFEMFDLEETK